MAKKRSPQESLNGWREAEERYRQAVDPYLLGVDGQPPKLTKDKAVALSKVRAKADQHMERYFKSLLK